MELTNTFHNTRTRVRMSPEQLEELVQESVYMDPQATQRLRRIKRRLCPVKGCTCSGPTGER